MSKGQLAWNKGLTKETDSRIKSPGNAFKKAMAYAKR